jgi:hypothetical protein
LGNNKEYFKAFLKDERGRRGVGERTTKDLVGWKKRENKWLLRHDSYVGRKKERSTVNPDFLSNDVGEVCKCCCSTF